MKKAIIILSAVALVLASVTACGKKDEKTTYAKYVTDENGEYITDQDGKLVTELVDENEISIEYGTDSKGNQTTRIHYLSGENSASNNIQSESTAADVIEETSVDENGEVVTVTKKNSTSTTKGNSANPGQSQTPAPASTSPSDNPANWSTQKIIDYYKSAAAKTSATGRQSHQTMTLNNKLSGAYAAISGIVDNALSSNSKNISGITGGYSSISVSDLKSASASRSGDYIYINMYPKTQVDNAYGKAKQGSVGHVVSVIDGIQEVVGATGIKVDYSTATVKLTYRDAYAQNIKINTKTGLIESGTWGYNVDMYIDGMKIMVVPVNNFNGTITYKVVFPA